MADPGDQDGGPFGERGFLIAAAVIAVVVVMGAVVLLTGGSNNDSNSNGQEKGKDIASGKTRTSDQQTASSSEDGCGPKATSEAVPRSTPANTKWELVGRIAAPTAPNTIGPAKRVDGIRQCFSRSPLGSLYALVNFAGATSVPGTRVAGTKELAAPSPGRDRALAEDDSDENEDSQVQIAGFKFASYDKSNALIDLALRVAVTGQGSAFAHVEVGMRWTGGDWKVSIPDTGDPFAAAERLESLDGYVRWSGA